MGKKRNRRDLVEAMASGEPVSLRRSLWKAGHIEGLVVDVGPEWVLVRHVPEVRPDGWIAVRLDTIRDVVRKGTTSFWARALAHRGIEAEPVAIDVSDLPSILRSAAAAFPLVTVHVEADPDICFIGRPQRITAKKLHLLHISSEARWADAPVADRLGSITRVGVGGSYEQALHELGGYPPLP